ncbi:hypothetical protein [Hyphomicrobium sp. DY-1]|uniref:hypothetical protein n=1 Tax=Hyphomicrobium sp. DY-1 TaxID=3075650 RepID=UPI0039C0B280
MQIHDPIEKLIADALDEASTPYIHDQADNIATLGLDFKVEGIFIECKAYHTDRSNEQLSRAPNIILVQGRGAAEWLANIIRKSK